MDDLFRQETMRAAGPRNDFAGCVLVSYFLKYTHIGSTYGTEMLTYFGFFVDGKFVTPLIDHTYGSVMGYSYWMLLGFSTTNELRGPQLGFSVDDFGANDHFTVI